MSTPEAMSLFISIDHYHMQKKKKKKCDAGLRIHARTTYIVQPSKGVISHTITTIS